MSNMYGADLSTREGRSAYSRKWAHNHRSKYRGWAKAYYARNRDKVKAQVRTYKEQEREKAQKAHLFSRHIWTGLKARAAKLGVEFAVLREDYPIPDVCPALNISLDRSDRNHTPSLDRIDNSKGYVPGNVVVVSCKANTIKRDLSLGELQQLAGFYGKYT